MKTGTILQQISTDATRTQCKYESVCSATTTVQRLETSNSDRVDHNRYKVQIDFNGKEYIRNRIYIKPRTDELRRSKRTISKPSRYQEYYT